MIFLDTSIFIAAAQLSHIHHEPSAKLLRESKRENTAAALQSLAETYNTLSGMPPPHRLPPPAALVIVQQMRKQVRLFGLNESEYAAAIEDAVVKGLSGALIYDALIVRCARKAQATRIYSWNARHFNVVAPDLTSIIFVP